MLQRSNSELTVDNSEWVTPQEGGLGELIDSAFGFLRRQYLIILLFTLIAAGAGEVYLAITPPTFTAKAQVIMGEHKAPFIQQQSMFTDAPMDTAELENQLQILQSKSIASSVLEALHLEQDPEFAGSSGGSILGAIRSRFLSNPEPKVDAKEAALAAFADRLTANRVGASRVIEIGFSSRSPERAAQTANAVADAYILDQLEAKNQVNRGAAKWLLERLHQLSAQSAKAERAVLDFKQQNNIVAPQGQLVDEQQVTDLNNRLVAARSHTSDVFARLNRIETILGKGTSQEPIDAAFSDALTSTILTSLRQQYLELTRREADWSKQYGKNHSAVVTLRNKIRDIRTSTFEEMKRLSESYKNDYEIAKTRQEEIGKQLAEAVSRSQTADETQVTLHALEGSAKSYRDLYATFLQRHTASVQQESFPIAGARLISSASTPTGKSKPKTLLVVGLALMGGIGLGCGVGLFRELRDRVFRSAAQLHAALQIPCLSLVPFVKADGSHPLRRKQVPSDIALGPRTITHDSSVSWKVVDSPLSSFAESIRSIKLAIDLNVTSRPNKIIGLTSSFPNEGKSTITAAVAQLMAQVGARVILVDCDFRNPSLSRSMAPNAAVGLIDVISGLRSLEEAVWRDPTTNLVLLPSVQETPLFHVSEVLAGESTKKLFDKLRANFDYVIVDLPPLAPVVDVRAINHVVDCMILVVEWGHTKIDLVQHALSTAPNVYESLIGAVLNKTDMNSIRRYDASGGALYNHKYYTQYD
jgi:exopolysaccharide transport family protein